MSDELERRRGFFAIVRLPAVALGMVLVLALGVVCSGPSHMARAAEPERKAVILSINDVYRIEGIDSGIAGGMGRVRALRQDLEKTSPDLLFLHAGDFLSPSFLGRTYAGEQMVDVMNIMDGDPAEGAFDERMFVAFGNHEFDDTHCSRNGPLADLVTKSEFTWLAANLDFSRCEPLKPLAGNPKIKPSRMIESGGLKIGLFGVTLSGKTYADIVSDPVKSACEITADLRSQGADVVVALTHLSYLDDLDLLGIGPDWQQLPSDVRKCQEPPDLVIGGHDHTAMAFPAENPRLFKADADALSAWVIEFAKSPDGEIKIDGRLEALDQNRKPDPMVERISKLWLRQHAERFCLKDCISLTGDNRKTCLKSVNQGACLKTTFAKVNSEIETEEIRNRSAETGFGDWLADEIREAGKADVAILNAGAIRLNQTLPAGTVLTRQHLEEMFPYKNKFVIREVTGKSLWQAIQHAIAKRGEGPWLHFSGLAVKLGSGKKATHIKIKRQDGTVLEIGPEDATKFKLASISFVLANGDGHGFRCCAPELGLWDCIAMLEKDNRWPLGGNSAELSSFLRDRLRDVDANHGLELPLDHRLCEITDNAADCLYAKW